MMFRIAVVIAGLISWHYITPLFFVSAKDESTTTAFRRNAGFRPSPTQPGAIQTIQFLNGTQVHPYAVQIGLPESLTHTMKAYCDRVGITDLYRRVLMDPAHELRPGSHRIWQSDGVDWYLQRPASKWKSNMHWLSANDEKAHARYMTLLAEGGFDQVLQALGEYFDLDGIDVYSVGFIGVTHCEQGFLHTDFENVDGKAFNVLIPLQLKDGSRPEFTVMGTASDDDDPIKATVHYEYNVALAVGDETLHGTGECDYRDTPGEMRMALSIYLADTNENNVESIIGDYTDPFPPAEPAYLLKNRGRHWKKDGSTRIPRDAVEPLVDATCPASTDDEPVVDPSVVESTAQNDGTVDNDEQQKEDEEEEEEEGDDEEEEEEGDEEVEEEDGDDDDDDTDLSNSDWTQWDRNQLYKHLQCNEVFATDQAIPDESAWLLMRQIYTEVVGKEQSTLASTPDDGFDVKILGKQSPGKGRGLFADEFIPKGKLVWTGRQKAWFPDAVSYRKYALALPRELACSFLMWSYIQNKLPWDGDEELLMLAADLEMGALMNSGEHVSPEALEGGWQIANVGCRPEDAHHLPHGCRDSLFALRDIYPGEELLCNYEDFCYTAYEVWDEQFGLGCSNC